MSLSGMWAGTWVITARGTVLLPCGAGAGDAVKLCAGRRAVSPAETHPMQNATCAARTGSARLPALAVGGLSELL